MEKDWRRYRGTNGTTEKDESRRKNRIFEKILQDSCDELFLLFLPKIKLIINLTNKNTAYNGTTNL